jgi:hypothetical protein
MLTMFRRAGACLLVVAFTAPAARTPTVAAAPTCADATATLTEDYAFVVGASAFAGGGDVQSDSTFRWVVNGVARSSGPLPGLLDLPFDDTADGVGGDTPRLARGVSFAPGRWGSALALEPGGLLTYGADGNLALGEGTVELWVALREDGDAQGYRDRTHVLLQYRAPGGDSIAIAQAGTSGIIYAGGQTGGQWQSAYGGRASMRDWRAGEWHHLAYTFSASGDFMRFYVDGALTADTNERHYRPPAGDGAVLSVGGDLGGNVAGYWVDALRITDAATSPEEIVAHARRRDAPRPNEVWLGTGRLVPEDVVVFEFTPGAAGSTGAACSSPPLVYPGIPIVDPDPPSTLLPVGATTVDLTVQSNVPTDCAWGIGAPLPFGEMAPFDRGSGTTTHAVTVRGIDPDPNVTSDVYVRCAAHPDYLLHLRYRVLSDADPPYPRTGNLWGSHAFMGDLARASRIDLWLGASFSAAQIRELRRLNPDIRVLTSINAVEQGGLTDDYYLKDIHGQRVEVWPGSYRLNLTRPYVAAHQARLAYDMILDGDLQFDGCFFDNVMTTQSWQTRDIFGNPFQVDADEDGVADDPVVFDAAWKAGVFDEIRQFRRLMPHAIVSGHAMNISESGIAELFNGISIGFATTDVIEGDRGFVDLWNMYSAWQRDAVAPQTTMIESSPPDQLSYGYDYDPKSHVPASTLAFGRDYYPHVRFGLALTLMNDGFFAHEWGDTWHGNDWWYDELDFDLGRPLGPADRVDLQTDPGPNLVENGDFEDPLAGTWRLWANGDTGCKAAVTRDAGQVATGAVAARVDITTTSGADWHVDLAQFGRSWTAGTVYEASFRAKADRPRTISLAAQKGSPDWRSYGLRARVPIGTEWQVHRAVFDATETTRESRLQFLLGETVGTVWLDDVRVVVRGPEVWRRAFDRGLVLLNGSRETQTVKVGPGFQRLTGTQAARTEAIIDDAGPAFSAAADWARAGYDSGEWQATGPFFHDWGPGCREGGAAGGEARWALPITAADAYTVTAWWPDAPTAGTWSNRATYEIVDGGRVVVTATLDQRTGGDEWHVVGVVALSPEDEPYVRLKCEGGAPCIADAIHLRSAGRYNDGSAAETVTLAPMDGIVLRLTDRWVVCLPLMQR